ncbi:N-acetyl-1-D-myo-inositol-2-amino-2-deoxy-alpha-D-glucopyranoside deacetylase [Corynebacterium choanae]|uniref:N-acetyl-1-D-myo-inositol-2-amino-2-deoxy-alpha- D-glucopyranoside deacetylase n=1 Tax=Corynebacterium choanae TaxID=1862358 RepID=UPI000F510C7C|nr:N-acetyl-1-D-myo-inositol-2-amino-2-deoxy-alpha-D-glucopyranoside deacetylase [Corynebacterium choanae]
MRDLTGQSIIAVHAHPDDEAIWTGGLLAQLARRGADVTVVTCTLGEQGEVISDPLQGLVADHADQLGGYRHTELQQSLAALQVRGCYLGGIGTYRDSGMVGDAANSHPRAFIHSGEQAVEDLVAIIDRLRPSLLVTYGPDGGYGHPDHIRAHEITHAAVAQLLASSAHTGDDSLHTYAQSIRILWAVTWQPALETGSRAIAAAPDGWRIPQPEEIACVADADIAIALDEADCAAKIAAMKAHATQLWIADGTTAVTRPAPAYATVTDFSTVCGVFALSNLITQPLLRREYYQLGAGPALSHSGSTPLSPASGQPPHLVDSADLFLR